MKRKKSFFVRYETNVNMWDAKEYDELSDYFDLEDMIISRYWLLFLEKNNLLEEREVEKLKRLEQKFNNKNIKNFIKEKYGYLYKKWIEPFENKYEKISKEMLISYINKSGDKNENNSLPTNAA